MVQFGKNLRLSVGTDRREAVRRFYEQGFGCVRKDLGENLEMYGFDDGANVGVFYVSPERALPDSAWDLAPWLEYAVDDVAAVTDRLVAAGAERIAFGDGSHPYLRGPGGPVFRLAKR